MVFSIPAKVLNQNNFLNTHKKYCELDPTIEHWHITSVRNYYAYKFLSLSLKNCGSGDILCAGISFGTTALILSEIFDVNHSGRKWILVDPMNGEGRPDGIYNTSENLIHERWSQRAPMKFMKKYLEPELAKELPPLCFGHLNTGNRKAESTSLSILLDKLLPHGGILIDQYGRSSDQFMEEIDKIVSHHNCTTIFLAETRQMQIIKN